MHPLSKSEYEILTLLWSVDHGLTAGEINELAQDKSWKPSSIHLILNNMMVKGAIMVDGMVRSGRTYSRIFKPTLTPEDYSLMQIRQNAAFSKSKNSIFSNLFASLLDNNDINMEALEEIESLIKKKKEER